MKKSINFDGITSKQKVQTTYTNGIATGKFSAKVVGIKQATVEYNEQKKNVLQFIIGYNTSDSTSNYINTNTYTNTIHEKGALCKLADEIFSIKVVDKETFVQFLEKLLSSTITIKIGEKNNYGVLERIIDVEDGDINIVQKDIPSFMQKVYGQDAEDVQLIEGYEFSDSFKQNTKSQQMNNEVVSIMNEANVEAQTKIAESKGKQKVQSADDFFDNLDK